jgi:hypothetical protein
MTTEVREILVALERAIRGDRRYFVAAKADLAFGPVKPDVERLLARLYDNSKAEAQRELAAAQSATEEMHAWLDGETATQDYKAALIAMTSAKASFQTESYFGNLDAVTLAKEARTKAQAATAAQKTSMQKAIGELRNKALRLRNSITTLLQHGDIPLGARSQREASELAKAMEHFREAEQRSQVERYGSYREALTFLNECVASLQALDTKLTSARDRAQSENSYRRLLAEAQDEKSDKLAKLHLASAFLILSVLSSSYFWFGVINLMISKPDYEGGLIPALLFLPTAGAAVALVIADRVWSIGRHEPGTEFQWHWLWLALTNWALAPVCLIITIIVYARGITSIQAEYQEAFEIANRLRPAPLPPERLQ